MTDHDATADMVAALDLPGIDLVDAGYVAWRSSRPTASARSGPGTDLAALVSTRTCATATCSW